MTIKPSQIIEHLQRYLPAVSSRFSDTITGTATAAGGVVTVSSVGHGLAPGAYIVGTAGTFENLVSIAADNGDGTLRFTTTYEHDLTEARRVKDDRNIVLSGFGVPWDGEHELKAVSNRFTFDIAFPAGETLPPATGAGVLVESRSAGLIGEHVIDTVPTPDTYTFTVSGVPDFPTGAVTGFTAATNLRIYGAADFERAADMHNKQAADKYALFVVMNGANVSKDRNTKNDSTATFTGQNWQRLTALNNFSTLVIAPAKDDVSGVVAQEALYGDVLKALLSVLFGFTFGDGEETLAGSTVFTGHGPGAYNTATYAHVYDWQSVSVISGQEGFNYQQHVAFRDVSGSFHNNDDDQAVMTGGADLDKNPV